MNTTTGQISKPFAESCEENKHVILAQLRQLFSAPGTVLEIGSGTGQHAVFFAGQLPQLHWQPSDRREYLGGIGAWLQDAGLDNVAQPVDLDVLESAWPQQSYDYIFSANTVHIMSWPMVEAMFAGLGRVLKPEGLFALYGPFNYSGSYTSDSNASFDQWLKQRDPRSGIRDFEALDSLAAAAGMVMHQDIEMPVNNRILVWRKQ